MSDIPVAERLEIVVRRPGFDLTAVPVRWLAGSRWATAFGNAGHVFIPLGEEFFIDSVRRYRGDLDDDLRRRVNAFIGQEAAHQRAHEAMWARLREWGLPLDTYVAVIGAVRSAESKVPPSLQLAVTAALEHYTAAFGHAFLTEDLAAAVPDEMARLLAWHGLEELEHRDVAFDVLAAVDDRYAVRLAGFVVGTAMLVAVPAVGTVLFGLAAPPRGGEATPTARGELASMTWRFASTAARHVVRYLRPGYHPANDPVPARARELAKQLNSEGALGR